ncbi:hypothetical protein [Rhodococcus koreensis]|uniref:hypothetical protein n=1 Tax=Rhodococcus koreensis TaxID=99653 RepID=UPI0036D9F828
MSESVVEMNQPEQAPTSGPKKEKKLVDPMNHQVYTATDDGLVKVHDPETGREGIFSESGEWHSGELRYANRQLLGWMGRMSSRQARKA